jgi:uncharacterized membrane protein (TIGR01666 family)
MGDLSRPIRTFFYSQYFSDGLRMAAGILLPALISQYFNRFDLGITLSLGALCICGIDSPGPVVYKRNSMALGNIGILIVAITTGFARLNIYTLGIEIVSFSFIFSMLIVYGARAASVGTSCLLVMVLLMAKAAKPAEVLPYSFEVMAGGVWYMLFSMVFFGIRPYRSAQQALGESVQQIVEFLKIKADFYLPETNLEENYRKLVQQTIQVSQQQDLVRELLFKSRVLVKESTNASRLLVLTFVDLVDMYEHIVANHYDYAALREKFGHTGILEKIAALLHQMAAELDNIGYAILSNTRYKKYNHFQTDLENLKAAIDKIEAGQNAPSTIILKKILINLRDINTEIKNIFDYYNSPSSKMLIGQDREAVEYSKFVPVQDYAPHIFFDNLAWSSASFKHAIRVSLVCLIGYLISKAISLGHHSYWILLTIIVILKPGFSLSKQRNFERLSGTILGGIAGVAILYFIPNTQVEFLLMVVLMIGTYSFIRTNYIVSVLLMTPYILILFKFLGVGGFNLIEERVIDTLIGSSVALAATYLLFPTWEFEQLKDNIQHALSANLNYLAKIAGAFAGKPASVTEYKLARKDVYVKTANLSAMFQRMTSEPKSRQKKIKDVHRFVVLNHILTSYIANLGTTLAHGKHVNYQTGENLRSIKRSLGVLNDVNKKLGGKPVAAPVEKISAPKETTKNAGEDELLKEQLDFINKISTDIDRITDDLLQ